MMRHFIDRAARHARHAGRSPASSIRSPSPALAQVLFPRRANGSLSSTTRARVVGSELIGQGFADPAYFQPRPSAAGDDGCEFAARTSGRLEEAARRPVDDPATKDVDESFAGTELAATIAPTTARRADVGSRPTLVTRVGERARSAHLARERALAGRRASPRRAASQPSACAVDRVAVREGRELGLLGEPRVNVLAVNLALDRQFGRPAHASDGSGTLAR